MLGWFIPISLLEVTDRMLQFLGAPVIKPVPQASFASLEGPRTLFLWFTATDLS